jgi:hypothetical protein
MMKRAIFNIILFISVFTFPWWATVIMLFIGIFTFRNFYEFIFVGAIIYSLYYIPKDNLISSPIFFTSSIVILYWILQFIRNNIFLYKT